jgi:hypothetical protein
LHFGGLIFVTGRLICSAGTTQNDGDHCDRQETQETQETVVFDERSAAGAATIVAIAAIATVLPGPAGQAHSLTVRIC